MSTTAKYVDITQQHQVRILKLSIFECYQKANIPYGKLYHNHVTLLVTVDFTHSSYSSYPLVYKYQVVYLHRIKYSVSSKHL